MCNECKNNRKVETGNNHFFEITCNEDFNPLVKRQYSYRLSEQNQQIEMKLLQYEIAEIKTKNKIDDCILCNQQFLFNIPSVELCENCDSKHTFCTICNEYHTNDQFSDYKDHLNDNDLKPESDLMICNNCFYDVEFCNDCNCLIDKSNDDFIYNVDSQIICEDCRESYLYCESCQEYHSEDRVTYIEQFDRYYCEHCLNDIYYWCNYCEQYFGRYENCHCDDCENSHYNLLEYHDHYELKYFGENVHNKKAFTIGFENELDGSICDDTIYSAMKNNNYVCMKDCSINSDCSGFEMISGVFTYDYIMNNLDQVFDPIESTVRNGMYTTDQCGMHIHVNKDYYTRFQIFKLINFFTDNPDFIYEISNRENSYHFKHFSPINNYNSSITTVSKNKSDYQRYNAINLNNPKTLEFRIFAAINNRDQGVINIQFVKAISEFAMITDVHHLTVYDFKSFLIDNRKEYLQLFNRVFNVKDQILR
jgi:hypothetical protein